MAGASKRRSNYEGRARKRMRMAAKPMQMRPRKSIPEVSFQRTTWIATWDWNTTTTLGYYRAIVPNFSQIQNYAEYSQLFNLYKITGVKVTLLPRYGEVVAPSSSTAAQTSYNNQFYLTWGQQKGASLTPTGLYNSTTYNAMTENVVGLRTVKLDGPKSYFFRPNISMSLGSTGAEIVPSSKQWLSTTDGVDVPHIGILAFIHDANFAALEQPGFSVDLQYTFYFKCKGTR